MFASRHCHRLDFADTAAGFPAARSHAEAAETGELIAIAGAADRHLLLLLACTAVATLFLALAGSLA